MPTHHSYLALFQGFKIQGRSCAPFYFKWAAIALLLIGGIPMLSQDAQAQSAESLPSTSSSTATISGIVSSLKSVAGEPKAVRASFAKGVCLRGNYVPSTQASQVTKSLSFTRESSVLARFSMGGGNPAVPENNRLVLRGFAFKLGEEGHRTDLLTENAPVHFAKNLDQMLAFLKVRIPGPDGKPDAEKVKAFSEANPETLNQAHFVAARPVPGSFAGTTYWGVHSFPVTNAKGVKRYIKFKVVPVDGEVTLTDDEAKAKPADFLSQDLKARIAAGTVRFNILAILDRPGDPTLDVTVRWPEEDERETVQLGTIKITSIEESQPCDASIFNPANLAEGVGAPPDEMFAARQTAYAMSLARRQREATEQK